MRILYFAGLRQRIGVAEEEVAPPQDVRDVGRLIAWLRASSPAHEAAFAGTSRVRAAVNQDFAGLGDAVAAGDEVAFFPPVTGG
ncbi:molybdopterin converting factor subunit 1 [Plastoroseomonas arctica]|uniref:Molybdopterin synthase sulfur carrier subunit n=1 Tax=Plastoroseomonas arctica TaxID=1509237 RepID=A0AAF1JVD2_9PROT|nr:molybdopterin converting factor subunit 1 [Plastoroseomonas arctica]MBR0654274.1 molybdopterin converting factor subunit 1 [Plastoroseomonas arctica]